MASVDVAVRADLLEDDFVDELRLLAPQEPRQPTRFSEEISETDKSFDQLLDFDGATFEKDVTLRNCRFLRGFSFKGATFKGKVLFSGCSVSSAKGNKSAFDGATFEKSFKVERQSAFYLASFVGVQFKQSANFKGSRFYGSAKFDGAHFLQPASFASVTFNGAGTFVEATFHKTANFDAAKFKYSISHARFRTAVFKELATFDEAEMSGSADFARANFLRGVTFNSARFCIVAREAEADAEAETTTKASGDLTVSFAEARFSSDDNGTIASFERTRFGDHNYRRDVLFDGALFTCARDEGQCSEVVFKDIETLGHFSMRSTFFRRGVNVDFAAARLEGDLDLTDAEFDGEAYFQKARISGSVSLVETQFQHYPDFRQVTFSHYPQLHLSTLPPEKYVPSERKDTALKIGALRRIAARTDDKATEQLLLVKELKLAGGVATRMYGLLSNYGRSWSRPAVALLIATVAIYPALYLGVAGLLPTTREQAMATLSASGIPCKGDTEGSAVAAAVEHSLRNALIVGAENETRSQAIQGCLAQEARANSSSLGRSLLETSQVLITLLLAFFVGAAVRLRLQLR